jgi:hypothetical protein
MKRLLLVLAVVAVALGMVLAGLIWHDSRVHAENRRDALEHLREEARQLVKYCELDGFSSRVAMGTSKFELYLDLGKPEEVSRALSDVVVPVIDAQELACSSAKTDIELFQRDADAPDRWIDAQQPKVVANLAVIARTRAASAAVEASLPAGPALRANIAALRAAANP